MAITISVPATKADFDGFGYVLWKSWHETYTGLIDPDYLAGITLERAQAAANPYRSVGWYTDAAESLYLKKRLNFRSGVFYLL